MIKVAIKPLIPRFVKKEYLATGQRINQAVDKTNSKFFKELHPHPLKASIKDEALIASNETLPLERGLRKVDGKIVAGTPMEKMKGYKPTGKGQASPYANDVAGRARMESTPQATHAKPEPEWVSSDRSTSRYRRFRAA